MAFSACPFYNCATWQNTKYGHNSKLQCYNYNFLIEQYFELQQMFMIYSIIQCKICVETDVCINCAKRASRIVFFDDDTFKQLQPTAFSVKYSMDTP